MAELKYPTINSKGRIGECLAGADQKMHYESRPPIHDILAQEIIPQPREEFYALPLAFNTTDGKRITTTVFISTEFKVSEPQELEMFLAKNGPWLFSYGERYKE